MIAVDTNLLVRYLTRDLPQQSAAAARVIEAGGVWVATTVLLETYWVITSLYGLAPAQVCQALRGFAGLPNITLENPSTVAQALDWSDNGLDFPDALHLAAARDCDEFLTFDRQLCRAAAGQAGAIKVRRPPMLL